MSRRKKVWAIIACFAGLAGLPWVTSLRIPRSGKGRFVTAPARINRNDQGAWELAKEFQFIDSRGRRWVAPAGTITDGASIPQAFLSLIGDRFENNYLDAAVVHDAYCGRENAGRPPYHTERWHRVHRMFFEACAACGTGPMKAKLMYAAVYLGGPRWGDPGRSLEGIPRREIKRVFVECKKWIEANNPPVERIERWMDEHESALRKANGGPGPKP